MAIDAKWCYIYPMKQSDKKEIERFQVRIPAVIHRWLKEAAEKEHRSLNAQIVHELEQAMLLSESRHKR